MTATRHLFAVAVVTLLVIEAWTQMTNPTSAPQLSDADADRWSFSADAWGYLVPNDESYFSPTLSADHQWLHLEARYNYESQRTGSLWAGYNFSVGNKIVFDATPMLGVVFGSTTGVAPGYAMALTYKRIELSSQGEYLIDTKGNTGDFLYSWNEFVYSPTDWFHAGLVAQRTRAYQTPLDVQRGVSTGLAFRKLDFTTYVLNFGWTQPTVILALGFKF
jgi:hypothetical protein